MRWRDLVTVGSSVDFFFVCVCMERVRICNAFAMGTVGRGRGLCACLAGVARAVVGQADWGWGGGWKRRSCQRGRCSSLRAPPSPGRGGGVGGDLLAAAAGGGWEVPGAGCGLPPEQTRLAVPPSPHRLQPWQAVKPRWRHRRVNSGARHRTSGRETLKLPRYCPLGSATASFPSGGPIPQGRITCRVDTSWLTQENALQHVGDQRQRACTVFKLIQRCGQDGAR